MEMEMETETEMERRSPLTATVTMVDVLEQQTAVERDAHAVLGGSDDAVCTFAAGYVKRQALYACLTCTPVSGSGPPAGICLACSLACHERHDLLELYTKRNFRCDCGGPKFERPCSLGGRRERLNSDNHYNHNFSGLYCQCERPYPDPDQTSDDDMIQCVVCEDWLHAGHLEAKLPHNDRYAEMVCRACADQNSFLKDYLCYAVTDDADDTLDETADLTLDISAPVIHSVVSTGDLAAETLLNVTDVSTTPENTSQTQIDLNLIENTNQEENNTEKTSPELGNSSAVSIPNIQHVLDADSEDRFSPSPKIELEIENVNRMLDNGDDLKEDDCQMAENSTEISHLENILNSDEKDSSDDLGTLKNVETLSAPENSTEISQSENISNSEDKPDVESKNANDVDILTNLETPVTAERSEKSIETDKLDDEEQAEIENLDKMDTLKEIEAPVREQIECGNINICMETSKVKNCEDLPEINELTNVLNFDGELQKENDQTENVDIKDEEKITASESLVMCHSENTQNSIENENNTHADILKDNEMLIVPENDDISKQTFQSEVNKTEIDSAIDNPASVENDIVTSIIPEPVKHDDISNGNVSDILTEDPVKTSTNMSDDSDSFNNVENLSNNRNIPKATDVDNSNEIQNELTEQMAMDDSISEVITEKIVSEIENTASVQNGTEKDSTTNGDSIEMQLGENVLKRKIDTKSIKIESIDKDNEEPSKKQKLDNGVKCMRPVKSSPIEHKGAIFWPCDWRTKLCTCPVCSEMYKMKNVLFLLDTEDTVIAYENLGKTRTSASQYEKGLEALSSLDRIQQINAITEYNKMKEKLLEFLKTFKDKREVVREEDIKGFFAGMKPKREPDGVYFCR